MCVASAILNLAGSLGVEDEVGQLAGQAEFEAFGDKDQFAARGDHHRAFIGGVDLLFGYRFLRTGRRSGCTGSLCGFVELDAGIFSVQFVGIQAGEGMGRGGVFPCGQIKEGDGAGAANSAGVLALRRCRPNRCRHPSGAQVAGCGVAAKQFGENVQIQLANLADVVGAIRLVYKRVNVGQQGHGGSVSSFVFAGIDNFPT